jgi:protein-disulfide isomerase
MVGYVFAVATAGLAGVLYLAYASVVVLQTVCLLCAGSHVAVIALFLVSGAADRQALSGLPARASRDVNTLLRTPAALAAAVAFILASASAVTFFPGTAVSASTSDAGGAVSTAPPPAPVQLPRATLNDLEAYLSKQPRVTVPGTGGTGAAVVIVKFNDYQCPPCGATFRQYKPVLARLQQQYPGKIAFITKDFPLETECNSVNLPHPSACEAAVAVRLAREKGRAEAMEEWLFANQSTLTPERVKAGAASVAGITDFDARYVKTLELVRAEAAEGVRLAVKGTPTFFLNGILLPIWPPEIFQAAIEWELRRVATP